MRTGREVQILIFENPAGVKIAKPGFIDPTVTEKRSVPYHAGRLGYRRGMNIFNKKCSIGVTWQAFPAEKFVIGFGVKKCVYFR